MTICTQFCESLKKARGWDMVLPSYTDLINQLHFTESDLELGKFLTIWAEIQQHFKCSFCKLVLGAITQTCSAAEIQRVDPNQPIRIVIFPGEQILRLSFPSRFNVYLAFVGYGVEPINGPHTARLLPKEGIDPLRVVSWLQNCDANHSKCSLSSALDNQVSAVNKSLYSPLDSSIPVEDAIQDPHANGTSIGAEPGFRLIDLQDGCIRSNRSDSKYVTLSYVWGNVSTFQLRTQNAEQLAQPGSLDSIKQQLPRTIRDAMEFVERLNLRFLWVDTLCLLQDNEDDMAIGISRMDQIYRGSYFTIVAGSAVDANSGLATLAPAPRDSTSIHLVEEVAPGVKMAALHSIDWHLRRSVYNTRGWTLQELVLPLRTVVLINDQVYFRCQESNLSEELWEEDRTDWIDPEDDNISRLPNYEDGAVESLWAYQKLCEEYSLRKLRKDGDVLRALRGISEFLNTNMKSPEIEGLPGFYIEHFLLFAASNANLRRRIAFASFSWAGWDGQITWPRENFKRFQASKPVWEKPQILEYLENDCILEWTAVFPHGASKPLTAHHPASTQLEKLVERYPQVRCSTRDISDELPWNSYITPASQDIASEVVDSQKPTREDTRIFDHSKSTNMQELDQESVLTSMWQHIDDPIERRRVQNRLAQANYRRRRRLLSGSSRILSEDRRNVDQRRLQPSPGLPMDTVPIESYDYRPVPPTEIQQQENGDSKDPRALYYQKEHVLNPSDEEIQANDQKDTFVVFPPYTVLKVETICVWVKLGSYKKRRSSDDSQLQTKAPVPLYGINDELIGSLQPDNFALLDSCKPTIECILISKCTNVSAYSALLSRSDCSTVRPCKLFWALYITWERGIAYRRGVCQLHRSILEIDAEPRPLMKSVILG